MSKRKNMGRGPPPPPPPPPPMRQTLVPAFMFSIIHACILSFFPLYPLQIFLLPLFSSFLASFIFLRFVFPFLVRSYKGLQKFTNKKLIAVKFTTLMRWQKIKVRKIFFHLLILLSKRENWVYSPNFNFPKIHLVHRSPPPPSPRQILHNNCFQLFLGITVIQQWLGKI